MNKRGLTLKFLIMLVIGIIITLVVGKFLVDLYKTALPGASADSQTVKSFNELVNSLNELKEGGVKNIVLSFNEDYVVYAQNKGDLANEFTESVISENEKCKEASCLCLYNKETNNFILCETVRNNLQLSGVLVSEADNVKSYRLELSNKVYSLA
ncbi:MAG: hypothetical protein PHG05_01985 [Candidatus Nanoarchaeia archaeon]|nr:hypothetical protein [Candidatus Nanoarchaeia archaeon]